MNKKDYVRKFDWPTTGLPGAVCCNFFIVLLAKIISTTL
jgi:hypothetical protein